MTLTWPHRAIIHSMISFRSRRTRGEFGQDLDPVGRRVVARRDHADAFARSHLDGADAAHAVGLQERVMAQSRDLDPKLLRNIEDRRPVLGFGLNTIDFYFDSFHAA